jgi:hypothetical protein
MNVTALMMCAYVEHQLGSYKKKRSDGVIYMNVTALMMCAYVEHQLGSYKKK